MSLDVAVAKCPNCGSALRVPRNWVGQAIRCGKCRQGLVARPESIAKRTSKPTNNSVSVNGQAADDLAFWDDGPAAFAEFSPEGFPIQPIPRSGPYSPVKSRAKWIAASAVFLVLSVIAGIIIANRDQLSADNSAKSKSPPKVDKAGSKEFDKSVVEKTGPFPRRMLAISINQYLYANPTLYGSLTKNMSVLLDRLGEKWRIPRDQLYLLTDSPTSRGSIPPIKPVLTATIERFLQSCRPVDRIVLIYAGHAVVIEGKPYLVPFEGELTNKDTLVPLDWLMKQMAACRAQQKLLIFDACRNDPGRGNERPSPGPMDPALEVALKSPPVGVQVWSSCSAKQSSFEFKYQLFEDNEIEGSLFLNQFFTAMFKSGMNKQKPDEPLPIEELAVTVNELTNKCAQGIQNETQSPFLAGAVAGEAPPYDPAEPLSPRMTIPKLGEVAQGSLADPQLVRSIFAEIKLPPIKAVSADDTSREELDAIIPFTRDALKDYQPDYASVQDILAKPDQFPLRVAVLKAVEILERHGKGDVMVGKTMKHVGLLREEFAGATSDAVKQSIAKEQQEGPAAMFLELEDLVMMLDKLLPERGKEKSKRWQAHYDYVTAMVKARYAYVNEYNFMLGKIRKDDLPPLDPKLHKGWRLAAVEKMSSPRDVKEKADDARKLFNKMIKDNPGTPWEVLAKRERQTALGLTWQPVAVKQ